MLWRGVEVATANQIESQVVLKRLSCKKEKELSGYYM